MEKRGTLQLTYDECQASSPVSGSGVGLAATLNSLVPTSLTASPAGHPGSWAALPLSQILLTPDYGNYFLNLALPAPRTVSGTQLAPQMPVICQVMLWGTLSFVGLSTLYIRV